MEHLGTMRRGVKDVRVKRGILAAYGDDGPAALEITAETNSQSGYLRPFVITSRTEALALATSLIYASHHLPEDRQ